MKKYTLRDIGASMPLGENWQFYKCEDIDERIQKAIKLLKGNWGEDYETLKIIEDVTDILEGEEE